MIIDFKADGTAVCLHSDEIPLQTIGTLKVKRASTVEWSDYRQEWEVWSVSSRKKGSSGNRTCLFHSASRQACLDWERDNWEMFL